MVLMVFVAMIVVIDGGIVGVGHSEIIFHYLLYIATTVIVVAPH